MFVKSRWGQCLITLYFRQHYSVTLCYVMLFCGFLLSFGLFCAFFNKGAKVTNFYILFSRFCHCHCHCHLVLLFDVGKHGDKQPTHCGFF